MKIKIRNIFKNTITKIFSKTPSAKLEREINLERKVKTLEIAVNRNKLIAQSPYNIDDVVEDIKTKKIDIHYGNFKKI